MKAVGIKTLKARLSEYIRMVKSGDTVLVTERDEVVAELRPTNRTIVPPQSFAEALERMSEKGEVTLASGTTTKWKGFSTRLKGIGISSKTLLDEIRKDRF